MYKTNTKVFYNGNNQKVFLVLGTKDTPYRIKISNENSYYIYPPIGFDYILGEKYIDVHKVTELIYAKSNEVKAQETKPIDS